MTIAIDSTRLIGQPKILGATGRDKTGRLCCIAATRRQLTGRRMTSVAGHDMQMFAHVAPSAIVIVPSEGGISHSPVEYTADSALIAGAKILLDVARSLSQ